MLKVSAASGFGAGVVSGPASRTFIGHNIDHTDDGVSSVYTFSNEGIGTAAADRYIVVVVHSVGSTNPRMTSMSVGGVSSVLVVENGAHNRLCEMFITAVPTGTTGDIVITMAQTPMTFCQIGVYAVYGLQSATPIDTEAFSIPTGTAVDFPALSTEEDGVAIWFIANGGGAVTFTWEDPTAVEDFDQLTGSPEGASMGGASIETTGDTLTESATISTAQANSQAICASFR